MRILALGDSITWGGYDTQGGWADRIKREIIKDYVEGSAKNTLVNLGMGGNTSRDLLKRVENETAARDRQDGPGILVAIGINDSRYVDQVGNPEVPEVEFESNLKQVLEIGEQFTNSIALIGLTPVATGKLNYKNYIYKIDRIRLYDEIVSRIADEAGLLKVNVFDDLLIEKDIFISDGLHLNDKGHKLLSEKIKPVVYKLLKDIN